MQHYLLYRSGKLGFSFWCCSNSISDAWFGWHCSYYLASFWLRIWKKNSRQLCYILWCLWDSLILRPECLHSVPFCLSSLLVLAVNPKRDCRAHCSVFLALGLVFSNSHTHCSIALYKKLGLEQCGNGTLTEENEYSVYLH